MRKVFDILDTLRYTNSTAQRSTQLGAQYANNFEHSW